MCVCVSVQWVRCLGTFDFCVQWPEFPKLFGGIFVKSLFFGVVVVLSVPVWDVIDLLKYCFQWLKSLSHLWTWIPRNESSKVLVVPVLECEVSVVLVSRSQNVNSQNSFGICLEWYKIPEPFRGWTVYARHIEMVQPSLIPWTTGHCAASVIA